MTETPAPKAKRELIGQITYDPANHAFEDETLEHARRKSVSVWRRRSVRQQVVKHLRRIASEHGLTNEVGQFFNNKGYPPPHITLASMLRMYPRRNVGPSMPRSQRRKTQSACRPR